jgi:hypothetical protein
VGDIVAQLKFSWGKTLIVELTPGKAQVYGRMRAASD